MINQGILDDCNYLISKAINNSKSFLNHFEEFSDNKSLATLNATNPNMFEELIKRYNDYILGNGLFIKKLMKFQLNEYQSFCFNILTRNPVKYKNHWYTYISNYIFSKYNEDISSIKLEDLDDITGYYDGRLSRNIKKHITTTALIDKELNTNLPNVDELIQIGETCKYDVVAFFDNELLYLLCGLAINEGVQREFDSFYSLFEFVKSYLQLWQFNKIYDALYFNREDHNLVTHIKCNGKYVKRYHKCHKYFKDYKPNISYNATRYIKNNLEDKIYIETKYNNSELNDIWDKLEELYASIKAKEFPYKENKIIDLYYVYVTSQLLTRSSCLSGLIILNILYYQLNKKFIQTNKDEQIDWLAISCDIDTFKSKLNQYTHEVDLEAIPIRITRVKDVLNYTHAYIASKMSR